MIYLYALTALAAICTVFYLACLYADDTVTVEPQPDVDPRDLCAVTTCHNLWQHDVNGWQLCHTHWTTSGAQQEWTA